MYVCVEGDIKGGGIERGREEERENIQPDLN